MAGPGTDDAPATAIQRDAAMISLIAHAQTLAARLAMLSQSEKDAVLALAAICLAVGGYTHNPRPDGEVIASFERMLEGLSPLSARRLSPTCFLRVCREMSIAQRRTMRGSTREVREHEIDAIDAAAISRFAGQLRALQAALLPATRHPAAGAGVAE